MTRAGATLAVFLALAAWAGAQGPAPGPGLTAADRVRLHRANRDLTRQLVRTGVRLGATDDAVERARVSREAAHQVGVALHRAGAAGDADRAAELADHLEALVRDGVLYNLDAARPAPDAAPGSPAVQAFRAAQADTAAEIEQLRNDLPAAGAAGDDARVRAVRDRLDALLRRVR